MRIMREQNLMVVPEGSISDHLAEKPLRRVYDTEAYSYAEILAQLSSQHRGTASLGTFNPRTGVVITESEVFA